MKTRKLFFIFACLLASMSTWAADGDHFWSTIAQSTQMSFTIISETDKTCEVGPSLWWNVYQTGGANTVKYTDGVERETLTVPSTVTKEGGDTYTVIGIGSQGLAALGWVTKIFLPSTINYIRSEAFSACTKLTTLSIPDGVTTIGNSAFNRCYKLSSITLPNSVTSIGKQAFFYCTGLMSVNFSTNMEEIPSGTFGGCCSLSNLVLPDNIKKIGSYAFDTKADDNYYDIHGESNLQSVVANGVVELDYSVFQNCFKLESITMNNLAKLADNPFTDTKWWNDQNNGLVHLGKTLLEYKGNMPAGTSLDIPQGIIEIPENFFEDFENLESVNLPQSIKRIGERAFKGCKNLTTIVIPNSVTEIGKRAFYQAESLESVTIPENLISIEEYTFWGCDLLNSVTLPKGLQSIGRSAFQFCKNLSKVYSYIEEPFNIDDNVFEFINEKTTLYVPDGTKSKYEAKTGWDSFSKIIEYGSIVTHEQIKLDANMMLYTGTYPLDFSSPIEGLKAYIITDIVDNEQAVLTEIEEPFPEESPILLIGTANQQYSIPVGDEDYKYSELIFNNRLRIKDENFYGSNYAIYYVYNGTQFVKTSVNDLKDGDIYLINYSMPSEASDVLVLTYAPTPKISEETQVELSSLGDKNLANNVVDGIYYNAGENSYNATEGCVVITDATDMSQISDTTPGSADVKEKFCGMIMRIAKGKGSIKVNVKTNSNAQLAVQIGNSTPMIESKAERGDVVFSYDIAEDAYVYIYSIHGSNSAKSYGLRSTDTDSNVRIYSITVTPHDDVTLVAQNYTRQYGESNPAFEYDVTEGTITSGTPEITCEATATSPVGTYDIIISRGTVDNNGTVNLVKGTLTITKAPLTIAAGNYTKEEGEENPEFTPVFSGFKNDETKEVLTKQPTITTTAIKTSTIGSYPVTISGAEAENYSITYENGTLTVTEPIVDVTLTAKSYTREYGEANPQFEYEVTEGSITDGKPEITCEATAASPVGTYDIVISKGTVGNNGTVNLVKGTLTITKAPLTITCGNYTIEQGDALPDFAIEYSGWKNDETADVLTTKPTVICEATADSEPGRYVIIANGAKAQNYDLRYGPGMLTIIAKPIIIEPIEGETAMNTEALSGQDLSDNVVGNIYYVIGENGYDANDQSIVISQTTNMGQIADKEPGSADVKENFNGMILKVAKGKGLITVNVKTSGNAQLVVQVGNGTPMLASKTDKGDVVFRYDVEEDTYVYIYAIIGSSAAKGYGLNATDTDSSVRIYSITVSPGATGIKSIGGRSTRNDDTIYDLQGRRVETPAKGIYIIGGQKVGVK